MSSSLAFSSTKECWRVLGEERAVGADGELVLKREELELLTATALRNVLRQSAEFYGAEEERAVISAVPEAYFDLDGPIEPIEFRLTHEGLLLEASYFTAWPPDGDEDAACGQLKKLLTPLLHESKSVLLDVQTDRYPTEAPDLVFTLSIQSPIRGKTIAALIALAEDAVRLCEALSEGTITRGSVGDLIRGGCAQLLIGQPEGNWLDAKSQEYDLRTLHGEISLAQAVSRFCNAEEGGIIVIGAEAKKVPGGEVIRRIRGVPAQAGVATRYRRVLDRRLYPPPLGLRIDVVPHEEERSLIVIDIPPQGEELKPFLVHGAIRADGNTEGAFISIVQRRGEESIPITAPMIHATMAAGRALLRQQSCEK